MFVGSTCAGTVTTSRIGCTYGLVTVPLIWLPVGGLTGTFVPAPAPHVSSVQFDAQENKIVIHANDKNNLFIRLFV